MRIIACALQCEAQALIDHFKMKSVLNHVFKIYQKDDITLVISGIGKLNIAAACAYVYAKYNDPISSWLNIGICGTSNKPIGSLFIANKISDCASSRSWYPPLVIDSEITGLELMTVDHPTDDYSSHKVYDMEAAGFYATCTKFTTAELVSCLKIVSDNEQHSINDIDKNVANDLIQNSLTTILAYFEQQSALLKEYQSAKQAPVFYDDLTAKFRFTKTQQHQLNRGLNRLSTSSTTCTMHKFSTLSNSKQVLQHLENLLSQQKVSL